MNVDYEFVNIPIAAAMLIFASYLDLRKREVEDKVWIIFGGLGVAVQVFEVFRGDTDFVQLVVSVGLAALIGLGIYFFGFYGGADGKALIVLGILVPVFQPAVGLYSLAPLITLTNGILISILLPIGLAIVNLTRIVRRQEIFSGFDHESTLRKILACFLGYRAVGKPREFQFPMEKIEASDIDATSHRGGKRFDFSFMSDEFETKPGTWVTPGIPLLVFFTVGFFVLLTYGDLVIGLVQFVANRV